MTAKASSKFSSLIKRFVVISTAKFSAGFNFKAFLASDKAADFSPSENKDFALIDMASEFLGSISRVKFEYDITVL